MRDWGHYEDEDGSLTNKPLKSLDVMFRQYFDLVSTYQLKYILLS